MKYTVLGFNQAKLIEYGLDTTDALLLRYFIDFKDTGAMTMEIFEDTPYYWVNYTKLIKNIPIIGIKGANSLRRRIKKLEECNVLKHYHKKEGGSYSFYAIGDSYKYLIGDDNTIIALENPVEIPPKDTAEKSEGYCSKVAEGATEMNEGYFPNVGGDTTEMNEQKINLLNNINLLKDYSIKNIYSRVVDYLNLKANTNYRSTSKKTRDLIKARLNEGFKEDDFYKVIDNKVSEWTGKVSTEGVPMENYLRPETLFGTKFEGYLNQKQGSKKDNVYVKQDSFNGYKQRAYDGSDGGMTIDELERELLRR